MDSYETIFNMEAVVRSNSNDNIVYNKNKEQTGIEEGFKGMI